MKSTSLRSPWNWLLLLLLLQIRTRKERQTLNLKYFSKEIHLIQKDLELVVVVAAA
jgi:hypothetical protein